MRAVVAAVIIATSVGACTDTPAPKRTPRPRETIAPSPALLPKAPAFDASRAMTDIRMLASGGPREATSRAYRMAAQTVARRFKALGYAVREQRVAIPAGVSWGIPVPRGSTVNVIAWPPGLPRLGRHLIVGAHLDTVPQSPGANDNASGVAIILELARLATMSTPSIPVAFVAFGAEEPRGPGDTGHHFGSRAYAGRMDASDRRALAGVVAVDRVGAGTRILVCNGGRSPRDLVRRMLAAGEEGSIAAAPCINRTSDHWPFERAGFLAARLDGGRFPGYHSARDVAGAVDEAQVSRAGRLLWRFLRSYRPA